MSNYNTYRITHREHGICIEGTIPLQDMGAIALLGKDNGYDLFDTAIAGHFNILMVIVNAESGNAWREELGIEGRLTVVDPLDKPDAPCKVDVSQDDRTIIVFAEFVNHDTDLYLTALEGILEVKGPGRLVTIDLSECVTLTGDWSRWLNTVAERYPKTEVLTGDKRHHREAFEARKLDKILSRFT